MYNVMRFMKQASISLIKFESSHEIYPLQSWFTKLGLGLGLGLHKIM